MKTTFTILATSILLLQGCMTTPYIQPKVDMPAQWQQQDQKIITSMRQDAWWKDFNDSRLNQLVEAVIASNNNLAVATLKVRAAQLQAGIASDQTLPSLSGSLSTSHSQDLKTGDISHSYSAKGSVSYEVDLWGRLSSKEKAARWEAEATEQDRESTLQSLIGTTVTLYWKAAYLNERIAQSEASIAYAQKTLTLVQAQHQAGATSQLESLEAEQSLASQEASHASLLQQQIENRNALAILLNTAPERQTLNVPSHILTASLPGIAPGLPSELLARRPDLKAAELRLRKSLVTVDATRASYYPTLTLTGILGSSSTELVNTLKNPVGSLGAELALPFLQWRQMHLNIQISETEYEEATANFRQTLYSALADVENSLSARQQYQAQNTQLEKARQAAIMVEKLYETRYRMGAVSLQSWLDAQEKRRTAENSLAENRYNQFANHATLCQALGGRAAQ